MPERVDFNDQRGGKKSCNTQRHVSLRWSADWSLGYHHWPRHDHCLKQLRFPPPKSHGEQTTQRLPGQPDHSGGTGRLQHEGGFSGHTRENGKHGQEHLYHD